jgi:hypothetical protein
MMSCKDGILEVRVPVAEETMSAETRLAMARVPISRS